MDTHRILVVDDEAHITHVVALKLRNAGYSVTVAGDGEEAYELAVADPPHMVITDLQMPYMSGLELCAKLKKHGPTSNVPAIMLTARGYALSENDLAPTNIRTVMSKPFGPRQLLERVNEILGVSPSDRGAVAA